MQKRFSKFMPDPNPLRLTPLPATNHSRVASAPPSNSIPSPLTHSTATTTATTNTLIATTVNFVEFIFGDTHEASIY
jgi:hypothetical protein